MIRMSKAQVPFMITELFKRQLVLLKNISQTFLVIADTCLCEYTSHGHCGVVEGDKILNDASLDLLAQNSG